MTSSASMFSADQVQILQDSNNCLAFVSGTEKDTQYGYLPYLGAGIAFCILFAITLSWQVIQIFRFRRWTSILLGIGALTELVGWAGRTWSAQCVYNQNAYLIQICTLIIAPVFYTAALYVLLGMFIKDLGRNSSLLSARMYSIIFCTCDFISLIVQAAGGALASLAAQAQKNPDPGTNIMIIGVVLQLITMTIFAGLAADFARRATKIGLPSYYVKLLVALFVSYIAIYVRSVFRTIELSQGWTGYLMLHQDYFIGLDGCLMVVAGLIFLAFDPVYTFPKSGHSEKQSNFSTPNYSSDKVVVDLVVHQV